MLVYAESIKFGCPRRTSTKALPVHSWIALTRDPAPSCPCAVCVASPPRATLLPRKIELAAAQFMPRLCGG
jgi:hypothetical protein